MGKPNILTLGGAAAWGDFAEASEPLLGNLYAVSIRLPAALKKLYPTGGATISMLASAVTPPDEKIAIDKIPTKLSDYDAAVGKERGELVIVFKEQVGVPVISLFAAWHKLICDARNGGLGFPTAYKTEVWWAALTGDGTPYYWWGVKRAFPVIRGKADFGFENKKHTDISITFSYLELMDVAEKMTGEGGTMMTNLSSAAKLVGV